MNTRTCGARSVALRTTITMAAAFSLSMACARAQQREVLYSHGLSGPFEEVVNPILVDPGPEHEPIPDRKLKASKYFFRLTQRRYAIDDSDPAHPKLSDGAILGGEPFVFLTVPEAAWYRDLYGILSDLGYGAEDILRAKDQQMVGLVYAYEAAVTLSPVRDGKLGLTFHSHVYVPTWANSFALLARLAADPKKGDPLHSLDLNARQADLARFFPPSRQERIAHLPYELLRSLGGPDWEYRSLLESQLGMNSHFRGIGITENTLSPADTRKGVPEFVGPNRKIEDLPHVAVIDMGALEFVEVHR